MASQVSAYLSETRKHSQKNDGKRGETEAAERREKEKEDIIKKLEKSDPEKWIILMEKQPREKGRDFFIEIIKTLNSQSGSESIICLGKIADMNFRRIYILGKNPAITELAVDILKNNGKKVDKDRRYYIDITGFDDREEKEIKETIQSGLLKIRSLNLPQKQHSFPFRNFIRRSSVANRRKRVYNYIPS